jgi:hypothetical protein
MFIFFVSGQEIAKKGKIDSILLCPDFGHKDVSEIVESPENKVAVCVSGSEGSGIKNTGPVFKGNFLVNDYNFNRI